MIRSLLLGLIIIGIVGSATFVKPVYAASQADCSIWLCLPFGFPSGCGDAKKAFKKRIKRFKPPLPHLSSCLIKSGGGNQSQEENISSVDGKAAWVPEYTQCKRWKERRYSDSSRRYCVEWKTIPTHVVENTTCRINYNSDRHERSRTPTNCSQTIRYVRMLMDGTAYGETYYFDNSGNEFKIP
jgi:hypothetical protein